MSLDQLQRMWTEGPLQLPQPPALAAAVLGAAGSAAAPAAAQSRPPGAADGSSNGRLRQPEEGRSQEAAAPQLPGARRKQAAGSAMAATAPPPAAASTSTLQPSRPPVASGSAARSETEPRTRPPGPQPGDPSSEAGLVDQPGVAVAAVNGQGRHAPKIMARKQKYRPLLQQDCPADLAQLAADEQPQPQRQQAPAPAARRPVAIPQLSRLAAPASGLPRAPGQVGPGPTGPTMGLVAAAWRAPTSTRASRIAGGSCIEGCMPAAGPAAAAGMLADAPARLVSHHPPAQWSR